MSAATLDSGLYVSPLVRDVIDDQGRYDVRAICQAMGIPAPMFARLTHRALESVARWFAESAPSSWDARTQVVLRQLVQIIGVLRAMGLEEDVQGWMDTPLPGFGNRTPADVITEGRGQELIERLVATASGSGGL